MRDDLRAALDLQAEWTQRSSPAMVRRGTLIRDTIPGHLRDAASRWDPSGAHRVQGSDGRGRKAAVPWVRIFDPRHSPSATIGWYVVYLFSADGGQLYLALIQGATTGYGRRELDEVRGRSAWARTFLAERLALRPDLVMDIDLRSRMWRPVSYVVGTVAAFAYSRDDLPEEATLLGDVAFLVAALGFLTQGPVAPEISDAVESAEEWAGRRKFARRLTGPERVAIERRAVEVATAHLVGKGYDVEDVGAWKSYDLDARRGDGHLFVEVKGTTSNGAEVVLTRAEVDLHRREYPNTMLAVVTEIALDRAGPTATGGNLRVVHPWRIERADLDALAFRYTVPR